MFLKGIFSGIVFLIGISLTLTTFAMSAEAKGETKNAVSTEVTSEQQTPLTPTQRLAVLTSTYQEICTSKACKKQFTQLKKYGRWGDAKSQLVVASAYLYGDGVEQDIDKAISWLKRTAYNTSSNAAKYSLYAFNLMAQLYQKGIGVEQDSSLANKYLDKLAERNYGPELFDRAFAEFDQNNVAKGVTYLQQASESNFDEASYYLARMYQQGNFIEKDINKAASYYQKVVKKDYKDSRQRLEALITEMEENSSTLTHAALAEEKSFISKLNATLDIEIITVNHHAMDSKSAMIAQLAQLRQIKSKFRAPTGSRIKGRTCGQTSHSCKFTNEEDIEDARNENPLPAF
jgi:TPR repeat protein